MTKCGIFIKNVCAPKKKESSHFAQKLHYYYSNAMQKHVVRVVGQKNGLVRFTSKFGLEH